VLAGLDDVRAWDGIRGLFRYAVVRRRVPRVNFTHCLAMNAQLAIADAL